MAEEITEEKKQVETSDPEQERKLYNKARNRAAFIKHLLVFILVNALIWVIWAFVFRGTEADTLVFKSILFVSIAWIILLIGHYVIVFTFSSSLVEKEIKKLKKQIAKDKQELEKLKTIAAQKKAELTANNQSENNNQE